MPHYAYLKLKMPDPRGIIIVNGNTERSLRIEEHTDALAAEVRSDLLVEPLFSCRAHGHRQEGPNYHVVGQLGSSGARLAIWPLSHS